MQITRYGKSRQFHVPADPSKEVLSSLEMKTYDGGLEGELKGFFACLAAQLAGVGTAGTVAT